MLDRAAQGDRCTDPEREQRTEAPSLTIAVAHFRLLLYSTDVNVPTAARRAANP
jgi:hypothetical protein